MPLQSVGDNAVGNNDVQIRKRDKLKFTIVAFLWFSIFAVLIGFPIVGHYKHEFLGYIAFGFFPAAILTIVAILISYSMKTKSSLRLTSALWVAQCIYLIVFVNIINSPHDYNYLEKAMVVAYPMSIYSFPLSFLLFLVTYLIGHLPIFVLWLVLFVSGYIQWFVLIPFLLKKWKG